MAGAELIGKEELEEINELFSSDKVNLYRYGQGNYKVKEFEKRFADYMGVKYAHAVSSGTAAIHSCLSAIGIKTGDEVITTAWTFVAPVETIAALGAVPILVNIDKTYHLDPEEVEQSITEKTKAIVSVPMWASPQMEKLISISQKYEIPLVEDAAQSLGAEYKGQKVGTFGTIGSFSFDAGKTLHVGEGGMIITNNKELFEKAAEFSDHGHMHLPEVPRGKDPRRHPGLNYRMSELTAAVGIAQLNKIDFILSKAKENKSYIKESIKGFNRIKFREFIDEKGSQGDTLIFRVKNNDEAIKFERILTQQGFGTKILPEAIDWHFAGVWDHILGTFKYYEDKNLEKIFKKTGDLLKRSICLNIPVTMNSQKKDELIEAIRLASLEISK